MTLEELEIIVTAKVEEALKEFQKILPTIKQTMKQAQEAFSKVDTKTMTSKLHQAVQFMKKKMQDFKKSTENNEIAIKVTNKESKKQISQIQKQIDSLQEKINARKMKLDIITPKLDKIANEPMNKVMPERLENNKQYINLSDKEEILVKEIQYYNKQLNEAKSKMAELEQQTIQTATTQNKLSSFFSAFKQKIEQVKPAISKIGGAFSSIGKSFSNAGNKIVKIFDGIKRKANGVGNGFKGGLKHVMKYAMALFSLRGIYSVLSNCASSWLSSQNAGAKQLSANIDYMKYAMGSALAPVIQFVINLVYQLMKAVQSVAYALTGVNIFAKATASSYSNMAGSAKKAKEETKQLAGVHNEINNIQDNEKSDSGSGGGATPSFDLSQMDNTSNSIIEAIKNGNWYEVGVMLGQKLNDAMNSIPWDKIQETAKKIGTNIAHFLNGFIATTDWNQVGNTFAQGLNTIIYFGYSFVTTFDWKMFGKAIGDSINGFFKNVDWTIAGQTLGDGIKGVFTSIYTALEEIDWQQIARDVEDFVKNIDWGGVIYAIIRGIAAGFIGLGIIIGTWIGDAIQSAKQYFEQKIEECGGNIVAGILKGIVDGLMGIGQWIYDNMIKPIIDSFCSLLGIHSPSTVFARIWTKYNTRTI